MLIQVFLNLHQHMECKCFWKSYIPCADANYIPCADANPPEPSCTCRFRRVAHAFDMLSDEDKRAEYDEKGEAGHQVRNPGGLEPLTYSPPPLQPSR